MTGSSPVPSKNTGGARKVAKAGNFRIYGWQQLLFEWGDNRHSSLVAVVGGRWLGWWVGSRNTDCPGSRRTPGNEDARSPKSIKARRCPADGGHHAKPGFPASAIWGGRRCHFSFPFRKGNSTRMKCLSCRYHHKKEPPWGHINPTNTTPSSHPRRNQRNLGGMPCSLAAKWIRSRWNGCCCWQRRLTGPG